MGLFDSFKKKEEKSKFEFYEEEIKTNYNISNIIDKLNSDFYFISKAVSSTEELEDISNTTINGVVHLFATAEIAKLIVEDVNSKYNNKYTYYNSNFSLFLDDLIAAKIQGIVIYGILDNNKIAIIDKNSAWELRDLLTIYHTLCQIKNGIISKKDGYTKIKDINVYFAINRELLEYVNSNGVLEMPAGVTFKVRGNPKYLTPYYDIITFSRENGQDIDGVRAFASEYSALKYGVNKDDLCSMPLYELKEKSKFPVVIEPHRNWWVVF